MRAIDEVVNEAARAAGGLVTRATVLAAGGDDGIIRRRLATDRWQRLQHGVYLVGLGPPMWLQSLHAACLAGGSSAVASHRAAAVLWELDGIGSRIVEVTLRHPTESVIEGAVVHRSRRLESTESTVHRGIPVTTVERTLVDLGRYAGSSVVEMAMESAIRKRLTTADHLAACLTASGGRGRPGAARLRGVLAVRAPGRAAGSPAEVELLRCLRAHGVPDPVRQYPVRLRDGSVVVVDLAWPNAKVAVEWDGFDVHAGRRAFAADLERQNALLDIDWQLRRYTGSVVRRRPEHVAATLLRLLGVRTAA